MLVDAVDFPFWPQLPRLSFREQMIPQFADGLPGIVIDDANRRVRFDLGPIGHDAILTFYEKFLSGDLAPFGLSEQFSAGFPTFERLAAGRRWDAVKGQVTGPLTFALGVPDATGRPAYHNFELLDVIRKSLARKAQWQIERLRAFADTVIIFIDEPILSAFGTSAYLNIEKDDVLRSLNEVIAAIHESGGLAGVHCCGNTDWSLLTATDADIANFDAWEYSRSVSLYPGEIRAFLDRGGILAWGIVPTSDAIAAQTAESIRTRLFDGFRFLEDKGFDLQLLVKSCLLTPSCGAGNLSIEQTGLVFRLLRDVSGGMREEFLT